MQEQPTPSVSDDDVVRIVRRDFPQEIHATVLAVLNRYGAESWQDAAPRVRLAALKLASGNLQLLQSQIETACEDFRDVIAPAEYPAYRRHSVGKSLTADEKASLYAADWSQYTAWLYGDTACMPPTP